MYYLSVRTVRVYRSSHARHTQAEAPRSAKGSQGGGLKLEDFFTGGQVAAGSDARAAAVEGAAGQTAQRARGSEITVRANRDAPPVRRKITVRATTSSSGAWLGLEFVRLGCLVFGVWWLGLELREGCDATVH